MSSPKKQYKDEVLEINNELFIKLSDGDQIFVTYTCPFCGLVERILNDHGTDLLIVSKKKPRPGECFLQFNDPISESFIRVDRHSFFSLSNGDYSIKKWLFYCKCGKNFLASKFGKILRTTGIDPVEYFHEKKAEEQKELEAARKIEKEKAIAGKAKALNFLSDLMAAPVLIIDSNIWMNLGYDPFFQALEDVLKRDQKGLVLYGPQFDEMCNVKRRSRYGTGKNKSSRCAINRIEKFQAEAILRIEPLSIGSDDHAYADLIIVKLIMAHIKNGKNVCFLSDDVELRIRVRGLASGGGALSIVQGQDFLPLCRDYCLTGGLKFEDVDVDVYSEIINEDKPDDATPQKSDGEKDAEANR